ncbi:MAG: radical SAM protein [Clostridiaceae bacterium]
MQCFLCPRRCGVDRAVQPGFCGAMEMPSVAKIMLHHWEEPFLSGVNGSGTVFFSGCNLGCVFCQNHEIRDGGVGEYYNAEQLSSAYLSLQAQGAHNINLVTAAHHVPIVAESLRMAKGSGLSIPVVYNSGGYELVETLRLLDGLVDVYLPDIKYVSSELSERFSGAPDYFTAASAAVEEMYRQVGDLVFDVGGIALRGLVIRHLVLPNCVEDSRKVLDYIVTRFPLSTQVSIMSQFTPQEHVTTFPLNRRITPREYDRVISYALSKGLYNILIQQLNSASAAYTPTFTDKQ